MIVKKILTNLAFAVAVLTLPQAVWAQTSSINAFSPYSMYGIGELNTQGSLPSRSMGGVGVAMRGVGVVNLFNPAAFSASGQKSFLFNLGLEGQNYYNSQKVDGATKKSAYNSFNFHDVAFQLPLTKGLGLGFSLTPYSSVGYRMTGEQFHSSFGWVNTRYEGEGDVTEVKLGVGWEIFKNFSVGVAGMYYWGDLTRTYTMTPTNIVDNTTIASTLGTDDYSISRFKGQFGLQWDAIRNQKRVLTLGATYDIGGELNPTVSRKIYVNNLLSSVAKSDTTHLPLLLPMQLAAGVCYQTPKLLVEFDYVFQNWGSKNHIQETTVQGNQVAYTNTSTLKFGVEYTPNRYDIRHFMKRWSYRAGVRYGDYYQTIGGHTLSQCAVTVGVGVPVKFLGISAIDVGFEYGTRGSEASMAERVGLVKQRYFKFAIGFTLFAGAENGEYWFLRPKYE